MKIAIVGTRGMPAAYGGFETLAWELSTRLAAARSRGHRLLPTRAHRRVDRRAGGRPAPLPALPAGQVPRDREPHRPVAPRQRCSAATTRSGSATSPTRSLLCGPAAEGHQGRAQRRRHRAPAGEVGPRGRAWYAVGERFALVYPDRDRLGRGGHPRLLPGALRQGVDAHRLRGAAARPRPVARPRPPRPRPDVEPGRYFLYVSRLEPENQADLVIRAYRERPGRHAPADRR